MTTIEPDGLSGQDHRKLLALLAENLDVTEDQLTMDARLEEDLGADSLDQVEITMQIEDQFQVTVPDELAEKINTVGDLFEVLSELLEANSGR